MFHLFRGTPDAGVLEVIRHHREVADVITVALYEKDVDYRSVVAEIFSADRVIVW